MSGSAMPRGGDHELFDELAVGWALHALEPEDEALFARHLPDCARCARTVTETVEVMAALASDLPPAEPSEELRQRLRSAVEATEQVQLPVLPAEPPDRRVPGPVSGPVLSGPMSGPVSGPMSDPVAGPVAVPPPWAAAERRAVVPRGEPAAGRGQRWRARAPRMLLAAAAALVVGLGAWDVSLVASRQHAQEAAAERQQIVDALMAPGQATIDPVSDHDGHAVATVVARHGRVQVVTWGLDVNNRAASTYVVWGMQQDFPVPLGTFDVVASHMDLRTVGSDKTGLDRYSAYAISIEPGRTAPPAPSQIVANG